jgi:hypothetical protein
MSYMARLNQPTAPLPPFPPELGPLPPPGPIEGIPRPARFRVTPNARHGVQSSYACGCRCPHCKFAWREYRRDKVRVYAQRKRDAARLERARQLLREAGELP